MLKKNVYILYPAGYYGTYVNWAINISDSDRAKETVLDPINREKSDEYGGVGTSHLHTKIPTHQGPMSHFMWVMYNKPVDTRIYNINMGADTLPPLEKTISILLNSDPDPTIIVIHDNSEMDMINFGTINAITKWPTQFAIRAIYELFGPDKKLYKFDPFNCADDINFRNLIVEHHSILTRRNNPINHATLKNFVNMEDSWYRIRNKLQPHEINEETYINPQTYVMDDKYKSNIFELSCLNVVTPQFPDILENILNLSKLSDSYDTSQVRTIHQSFIDSQPNLKWFDSINNWRETGVLDKYLLSHSCIQGMVLKELLEKNANLKDTIDWKTMSLEDINQFW
jgi:hypothetical protein